MKNTLYFLCLLSFTAITQGYSQSLKPNTIDVKTVDRKVVTVDMNNKDCVHVIDGLVTSYDEAIPAKQLAHFEQVASQEKLTRLGFNGNQCVMVKSSADIAVENYIYRQVHAQVQQVGTKYKLPIAVNGKLTSSYANRRAKLGSIKPEQIKEVKFLDKEAAQAKYGDSVVFGLIEITV
jgi:hypothetical protein